jgi:hypothetical protein
VRASRARRDVRTFCRPFDVNLGVKNFLKRLGVTVGGFVGFCGPSAAGARSGEDDIRSGCTSAMTSRRVFTRDGPYQPSGKIVMNVELHSQAVEQDKMGPIDKTLVQPIQCHKEALKVSSMKTIVGRQRCAKI